MFKSGLLVTTALVIVGTLSFFAAHSAAAARSLDVHLSRDRNSEFIDTYNGGKFSVYASSGTYSLGSSALTTIFRRYVAVPIVGRGQIARRIVVKDLAGSRDDRQFSAGIYSNTASGIPGKLISGGTAMARERHFLKVKVPIAPTKLERNTTYWIEEMVQTPRNSIRLDYWKLDKHSKNKAYIQFYEHSSFSGEGGHYSSSYTSPWTIQSGGPYLLIE